jgi:predicted AAA+ superfamily ATPase
VYGRALEHLIFLELKAYIDYRRLQLPLTYWRTQSKLEVDFVIGDSVAIEVKGKGRVGIQDTVGIKALDEELSLKRKLIVCNESDLRRLEGEIEVVPLDEFPSNALE